MNGAGPVHGKEASKGARVSEGRGQVVWLGGRKRGCCSGLSDTMRQSELQEHLCSGQLDGLLGEGLVVWLCNCGGSRRAHGGERGVRARQLGGLQYKWRQLRRSADGGTRGCALEAAMWVVASTTRMQAAARGAATRVEAARRSRTLGVRELVTARALVVTPLLMNH